MREFCPFLNSRYISFDQCAEMMTNNASWKDSLEQKMVFLLI